MWLVYFHDNNHNLSLLSNKLRIGEDTLNGRERFTDRNAGIRI